MPLFARAHVFSLVKVFFLNMHVVPPTCMFVKALYIRGLRTRTQEIFVVVKIIKNMFLLYLTI